MNISRNDAKSFIKNGKVFVNGIQVKSTSVKLDENNDTIVCDGKELKYSKFVYIMMNKPKGIVSASEGKGDKTVVDILPSDMKRKNLFPAGRLDKDTTGFMLITDDGEFAHKILSPKSHIPKTYIATLDKPFDENVIDEFEKGVQLYDDLCLPALLSAVDGDYTRARVTIKQGMYHQIKRMFKKIGLTVVELERIKMGDLSLDKTLKLGECRYLTSEELKKIKMQ
jgi:16S rRNA pseudouridine516 synthase